MKFLWLLRREIRGNIFSTLLIFLELFFLIIALCICISLSQRVIGAARFFNRFEGRAVTAAIGSADKQELESAFDGFADLAVTVTYYHTKDSSGQTVYLGDYSKSAFTELSLAYSGDMVDTEKDYGEAVPAMVSRTLADKYKTGSTYSFKGVNVYICGALNDDYLYILTADMTNEDFLMCYDIKGLLQTLDKSNSANAFLTADSYLDMITFRRILQDIPLVNGTTEFDWKKKLGDDFDRLSGNLIIGILVLMITMIGFIANNILSLKKNKGTLQILSIIGQPKHIIIAVYLLRHMISLFFASAIVSVFINKINTFLGVTVITYSSIIKCVGICAVIILISSLVVIVNELNRSSSVLSA